MFIYSKSLFFSLSWWPERLKCLSFGAIYWLRQRRSALRGSRFSSLFSSLVSESVIRPPLVFKEHRMLSSSLSSSSSSDSSIYGSSISNYISLRLLLPCRLRRPKARSWISLLINSSSVRSSMTWSKGLWVFSSLDFAAMIFFASRLEICAALLNRSMP